MEFVIVILTAIALLIWRDRSKRAKLLKEHRMEEMLALVSKVQSAFDRIDKLKTNAAKANHCDKALGHLLALKRDFPEANKAVENLDELIERTRALKKVLPIIGHVEKAYRHQFKGSDKAEKNALLDALYDIQTNEVSDQEFVAARACPEGTGEIVQMSSIESRLRELGWEG